MMAESPDSSTGEKEIEALILPADRSAVRRMTVRPCVLIAAVGGCCAAVLWYAEEHFGQPIPEKRKLLVAIGVVVVIGIGIVLLVSRLYLQRTTVGIATEAIMGPPLDPRVAMVSTALGRVVIMPYNEINEVALFLKGRRVVAGLAGRRLGPITLTGVKLPEYVRDVRLALRAVHERTGEDVKWYAFRGPFRRALTRDEAGKLLRDEA